MAECKIYEITEKAVIYSFRSITRNYTSAIPVCNPLSSIERAFEVYGSKRIIYGIEGTKFWAAPSLFEVQKSELRVIAECVDVRKASDFIGNLPLTGSRA